eukprot:scaffold58148_cov32-Tisochrysis_lutea.AAC.3
MAMARRRREDSWRARRTHIPIGWARDRQPPSPQQFDEFGMQGPVEGVGMPGTMTGRTGWR